ncbi:Putative copper export protein [Nakamurella panacisegetis]|uniref:Putative copper export protein n=1 Tax=Nakamurella panacisegetis TaxID=1090615 RepID=A0A1H0LLL8_9ACTN|nr:CopD family protein [Nakamurella panacisegetis]SDO69158.1 Putative copper export protein [Nakamurella panacisegetis]
MSVPSPHIDGTLLSAVPAPSTPLGSFADSAVAFAMWATLMGFVGLVALMLVSTGPAARRIGAETWGRVTVRPARVAVVLGLLAVLAVLTDLARGASKAGGFDYGAAWDTLFDGTNSGRLSGLEVTFSVVGAALMLPFTVRRFAARPRPTWLLGLSLTAGVIALGATKFPSKTPTNWGRTAFDTLVWMLHLIGGAVWIGGVAGLLLLALPGAVRPAERGEFWAPAIRRFSIAAMTCVGALVLSGLFLYWGHVDGPSQLFTTMYGRVLGVKILIFGVVLLLGVVNQFWLHPRIEALRVAGDERPLRIILARQFPLVVAVEVLLGLAVLFVAPFLHGSARNQAFQAAVAQQATAAIGQLPRIPAKVVTPSTWVWGTIETVVVIVVMVAGYRFSGRMAKRRVLSNPLGPGGRASRELLSEGSH